MLKSFLYLNSLKRISRRFENLSDEFKSYADRYDRISPARTRQINYLVNEKGVARHEAEGIAYYPGECKDYALASGVNYARAHQQLKEECDFRNVEKLPHLFVDLKNEERLGCARFSDYSITLSLEAYNTFNDNELRAFMAHELKHLYQSPSRTQEESLFNELDSDRAAVESVGYDVLRPTCTKLSILFVIDRCLLLSLL